MQRSRVALIALVIGSLVGCWRGSPPEPPRPAPDTEAPPPTTPAKAPIGGVIDIRGEHDEARARAEQQIRDHCGSDSYVITQETSETRGVVTSSSGTVQVTLWHFHYQCGGGW